ncbi:MAG TPA: CvpA family protein [Xanthomonadaceae bacterium]|nr:CvpA family protein [Xanthomonadaceae bacterium]
MLTGIDMVLLVIVGLSAAVGLWRGFVVEVMSLVVWVAAFWLAFVFGDEASALFEGWLESPVPRLLLGYALLFVAALVVGGLATWLIGRLVRSTGLTGPDRLLGLGFGLLRGVALACVLVLLLGFTALPREADWTQSRLLPAFQPGAEWLRAWLPGAVAKHVDFSGLPTEVLQQAVPGSAPGRRSGDEGADPPRD